MSHVMPLSYWIVKLIALAMLFVLLSLGGAIGCASNKQPKHAKKPAKVEKLAKKKQEKRGDRFFRDARRPSAVEDAAYAHALAGAQRDSTLRPQHFTGNRINSLGREMLDLAVAQRHAEDPLVVYLNLPEEDKATAGRRDLLVAYLADSGLTKEQYEIRLGHNPQLLAPAAPIMARMVKTESGAAPGFKPETAQNAAVPTNGK